PRPAAPPKGAPPAPPAVLRPDGFADTPWRVFRPRRALEPRRACQNAHTFNTLSDKCSHRFEEVNNYSRLMTRRFATRSERFADRTFQPLTGSQRRPVSICAESET